MASLQTGGQRCTSISRVLIKRALFEDAKALFVAKAKATKQRFRRITVGPLSHFDDVVSTTQKAISEGAVAGWGAPQRRR